MTTTPSALQMVMEVQASTIGDQAPTPVAGSLEVFPNQNGSFYSKTSGGVVTPLVSGASSVSNADGTLVISPTSGAVVASRAAITTDVSIPLASNVATIQPGVVTLGKMANLAAYSTIANNTSSAATPSAAQALILGVPGFVAGGGVAEQITAANASYLQAVVQNTTAGAASSTDFVAENDLGTDTTHYIDVGINSSGFTGTGSLNLPNAGYLYTQTGDLVLGTGTSNTVRLLANSAATDALQINPANAPVLPAYTGYVYANAGSAITAATTIPITALANQAANTFVANATGSPAAPTAITQTQATAMINPATASLSGAQSTAQFSFVNAYANATIVLVTSNAYSNLKCDGATDDAAALNTLYTNAPDHSVLMWPPGTMVLSTTVSIPAGKHFAHRGAGNQKTFWTITSSTVDMVSVGDWQNTFDGISFNTAGFTITGNQAITGSAQTLNITAPGSLLPASGVCTIPSSNAAGTATVWVVFTYTSRTSTTITGTATGTGAGFTGIPFGGAAVAGSAWFRTAGYFINGGTNTDIFITGCDFAGGFNGVLLNGTLCSIRDSQFSGMINFDMQFNGANVNSIIDNITCDGSPPAVAHVEVNQCGSLLITDCDIIRAQANLRLNPTSPNGCFGVYSINTYFDTATAASGTANSGNGVLVQGTGNVQRVKFTSCWLSSATHDGFWCNSTAATLPTDFEFLNNNIYSNGVNGIDWTAGQDFIAIGNQIAGNVTAGINLTAAAGSVTKALISANRIGPAGGIGANGTGIITATGTYGSVKIQGNDLVGNTTALTLNTVTVATWSNFSVYDNAGWNPHGAVATPTFPTTTTVVTNTTGHRVAVLFKSGATAPTVTTINGVSSVLPLINQIVTYPLDPGGTIALTFTVAGTWTWIGN